MVERKLVSHGELDSDHIMMWKNDLRGKIWDHVQVIGKIEHYNNFLEYITQKIIGI